MPKPRQLTTVPGKPWPADAISRWPIDKLIPYARNAREHSDAQVSQIAASIREFGWTMPALVAEDGTLIAGHGRILAARQLGITEIPTMIATGWSEAQVRAYRIADNKLTENSTWNDEFLRLELADLGNMDFSLDLTGFSIAELDELLAERTEGLTDPDDVPEAPEHPVTVLGDIWLLGRHRLLCGDSTAAATVERVLGGAKPHMIFADPPYGMRLDADYSSAISAPRLLRGKGIKGGRHYSNVIGDHDDFDRKLIDSIFTNFTKEPEIFLWGADYYTDMIPARNDGSWIVWDKRLDEAADRMYGSCFELCWSRRRHKREMVRVKWAGVFGVEKEPDRRRWHPTQKPVALASWFIDRWCKSSGILADPYAGSGTTIIAAEQTGRACHAIEISPIYADVVVQRWQNFTGNQASLEGDGRTFGEIALERTAQIAAE